MNSYIIKIRVKILISSALTARKNNYGIIWMLLYRCLVSVDQIFKIIKSLILHPYNIRCLFWCRDAILNSLVSFFQNSMISYSFGKMSIPK